MKRNFENNTIIEQKYRITELIGYGGMGQVYEAEHLVIGRKVAIKTLHVEYHHNAEIVARFHREAQTAGKIGHDHICEIIDVGTTPDDVPYIVMPLLNGHSLKALLKRRGSLSPRRAVAIADQILSALEATHAKQIVHRDLKPDNVFLSPLGSLEDFVRILDFGISKVIDRKSDRELTRPGAAPGTPHYMAPEQAQGDTSIDFRVDLYAVGVMLYEMITGGRPFTGDSHQAILMNVLTQPFELPSASVPGLPSELENVILKAMAREPAERFASAQKMRQAIRAITRITPTDTLGTATDPTAGGVDTVTPFTPVSRSESIAPRSQPVRRTIIRIAIALAILVALLIATWSTISSQQHPNRPDRVSAEPIDRLPPESQPTENRPSPQNEIVTLPDSDRSAPSVGPEDSDSDRAKQRVLRIRNRTKQRVRAHRKKRPPSKLMIGENQSVFISDYGE